MIFSKFLKHSNTGLKTFWWVTGGAATLAGAISLWIGSLQSIWFDESYSIAVARQSIGEIVRLVSVDTHPPLYYLILHVWGGLFQWNEQALRLLSVLAFMGAIIVAGLLVRRLFGNRAATVAVIFIALAPLLMRYGFEIRMYALASLIGVLATYVLVIARSKSRWWLWAVYSLLVVIGMFTLYYLAMLWVAHLVWLLWVSRKDVKLSKIFRQPWFLAYLGSVILFLPWLPSFIRQAGSSALAPIGQPMNLENLIGVFTFNTVYQPVWQLSVLWSLAVVASAVALGYLIKLASIRLRKDEKNGLWLLVMYIGVPVAMLIIISLVRSMYVERYLSQVAIGFVALIGVIVALALRKPTNRAVLASAVIAATMIGGVIHLGIIGNFNFQRMEHPSVQQVADQVGYCYDNTSIVAEGPYLAIELQSVLPSSCQVYFYSDADHLSGGYATLDGSPLQLKTTQIPALSRDIKYAYYGDAQLTVAPGYNLLSQQTYGKITVATYQANAE